MIERFVIELCHGSQVVEFQEFTTVESAKERLATPMVNDYRLQLSPPEITGFKIDDEARYARQCWLLGIENVYA